MSSKTIYKCDDCGVEFSPNGVLAEWIWNGNHIYMSMNSDDFCHKCKTKRFVDTAKNMIREVGILERV